jgi:hypothetical protein
MSSVTRFAVALIAVVSFLPCRAAPTAPAPAEPPLCAVIETTLTTPFNLQGNGQLRQAPPDANAVPIKQFAFDGDPKTFFASKENPTAKDHFTLVLDKAVAVKSIEVATGKPDDNANRLDAGSLEVSADGTTFTSAGKFANGTASAKLKGQSVKAIRIQPSADMDHPLAIREITIDSDPQVAVFKYPVEIFPSIDDSPEMKEWIDKCIKVCERQYRMLNEELKSDGYKPATVITMTLKKRDRGVAETSGNRITGTTQFFVAHPDDIGAMVHETTHVVQHYRGRGNPGWLVEGLCDYVRFFKYEPAGKLGRINPNTAHYNGSYRVTAAFLNYLVLNYDKDIIQKLNTMMREGKYTEDVWVNLCGKTTQELDEEWRATLVKR